jgi:hypothetical protein
MTSSARPASYGRDAFQALAAYTTFVAVDAAKNQSGYPINLLDEEEVVQTRKTITIDAASGKLKAGELASGGRVSKAMLVCEIDFDDGAVGQ